MYVPIGVGRYPPNLRLQLHNGQRRSDPRPHPVAAMGFAERCGLGHLFAGDQNGLVNKQRMGI